MQVSRKISTGASAAWKGKFTVECRQTSSSLVTLPPAARTSVNQQQPWLLPQPKCDPVHVDMIKAYNIPSPPYPPYSEQEKWEVFERWMIVFKKMYKNEEEKMRGFNLFCYNLDNSNKRWFTNRKSVLLLGDGILHNFELNVDSDKDPYRFYHRNIGYVKHSPMEFYLRPLKKDDYNI